MKREDFSRNYWRYYCMLEKKFLSTVDFVEIHKDNFKCFSNEYALLLQAIGAELDNVFKLYCGYDLADRKTIEDYAAYILSSNPKIIEQRIKITGKDIELTPFQDWNVKKPAKSLGWWFAFDKIKHNRNENFKDAKQENVLNILSALFMLETMCFRKFARAGTNNKLLEPDAPDELSRIFIMVNWEYRFIRLPGGWGLIDGDYCPLGIEEL